MPRRIDLYRRDKPRRERGGRRPLTPARMWQVVVGLFLIFSGLAATLWLLGADFDSEYRQRWTLIDTDFTGHRRKLSACGMARFLIPEAAEKAIPCIWWNLGAFYVMPTIALLFAVKKTLIRD